jgi:hypothetical protein
MIIKGRPGGVLIVPKRAKMLRWFDWQAGMYEFRHSVRQGALGPRPFLTMTFKSMWPQISRIMTAPI